MSPDFQIIGKRLTVVALLVMLLFSGCQSDLRGEMQTTDLPAPGVTVVIPTAEPATEIPRISSPTDAVEQGLEEPPLVTKTPLKFGQPVEIVTPREQTGLPSPTVENPLIQGSSSSTKPRAATMNITRPGAYSKVSSPIRLNALVSPGDDRRVYVNLIGEDGRTIESQILDFGNYDSRRFNITTEIPFSINSAAELARIELYVVDQFGLKVQLVSVDVFLIQYGDSDYTPNEIELEPYTLSSPGEGTVVHGGVLVAEGIARTVTDGPLIVDLVDERGGIVASGETFVSPPSEDISHMPFQVIVPYTVDYRTRVRLTVRQESTGRVPGTVWLSSWVIFLDP